MKPNSEDPLKNRRVLAMLAAFNGFFVFPTVIIVAAVHFHLSDSACESLLHYMGVAVITPLLGYLYSAHKKESE